MKKRAIVFIIALLVATLTVSLFGYGVVSASGNYESWDDYGYGVRSQIDKIIADGADISNGAPGDYLALNKYTVYGRYDTLVFEGWAGYDMPIVAAGYTINDGENVFEGQLIEAEEGSHAAQFGGDNVTYYSITVPVTEYTEKTKITLLAKLEDDTAVALNRYDVYYQEKKPEAKKKSVGLTTGGTGTPVCFSDYNSVAFTFKVEEGWRLNQFIVVNAPTWDMIGAGLTARIYKWDKDYETTLKGKCIDTCVIEDHINCTSMVVSFYYIPAGEYLIEFSDFELKIGGYDSTGVVPDQKDIFKYFTDGEIADTNPPQLKMVFEDDSIPPEITPAPTEAPTPEPTEAPTEKPTEEPVATDAPVTTDAPEASDEAKVTDKPAEEPGEKTSEANNNKWVAPVIIIAAVVLCAAVAGIIIAKKKKK
ncbi:MAG: hypothetical protein J6Y21_09690 [Clostridia bacterium]|nr:hypothetical protein [Clostridia bacterium]